MDQLEDVSKLYDIYVELLSRISSVSVFIESKRPDNEFIIDRIVQSNQVTVVLISKNGRKITIPLPLEVPINKEIDLKKLSVVKQNTITLRIPVHTNNQLQHKEKDRSKNLIMDLNSANYYKWSANFLKNLIKKDHVFKLKCFKCNVDLLSSSSKVSNINEMPSELWAEMMDFWHCHKPHIDDDHEHSHETYERYSSLNPLNDELITGSYYFAIGSTNDSFENISKDEDQKLFCQNCNALIGDFDKTSSLDKIFKWSVKLKYEYEGKDVEETYKPYQYVYNTLLDNVNSSATRLVEFINEENDQERLLVWVFNVGIDFNLASQLYHNSMKIYYTTDLDSIKQEKSNRGENLIEETYIPKVVYHDTIETLVELSSSLPKSLRKLGENWEMGLLHTE